MGGDVTLVQPRADSSVCPVLDQDLLAGSSMTGRRSAPLLTAARPVQDQARQRRREGWIGSSGALAVYSRVAVRDLARVFRVEPEG